MPRLPATARTERRRELGFTEIEIHRPIPRQAVARQTESSESP